MTIDQIFSSTAKRLGQKAAIRWEEKEYTFGDLEGLTNRYARGLQSIGVKKGDRVCIFMQNSPEFIIAYFGNLKAGAVTVPLNVMYRKHELRHMVNDSSAVAMVTSQENLQYVMEVRKDLKTLASVVVVADATPEGCRSFYGLLEGQSDAQLPPQNAEEDLAVICYTSGTTGLAKGAMLSHANFTSNISTLASLWELSEGDKLMMALPMFHVHGLGIVLHGMAYCGYSMVLQERFDPKRVIAGIHRHRCTVFMGVPTMYVRLIEEDLRDVDLSCVRLWTVGSAPMPVEVLNKFREKFGADILERYGMTETAVVIASNPYRGVKKVGSVGPAIPGVQLSITDDDDSLLARNEVGEIVVKGPNVMRGYWNRQAETEEAFMNGWFHTGDLGFIDQEGYLHIVGRKKEMIIASGFKIFPREVEEVIHTYPKVREVAVVGIPDPVRGESPRAYVVPRDGMVMGTEELEEYCRKNLAAYKVPRSFEFVQTLPRTPSGKILNRILSRVKVKDLMITSIKTIDRRTSAFEAAKFMKEYDVGSLIVTDNETPIGIVTTKDILYKVISLGSLGKDISLSNIMSVPLILVDPEDDIAKAAALMRQWNVWRLSVKGENDQVVGLLSGTDIFKAFAGKKMDIENMH
jgi:long-chain acyl-CoA synthetase